MEKGVHDKVEKGGGEMRERISFRQKGGRRNSTRNINGAE